MPEYQIYRLKDSLRQQFRWAPHAAGMTVVKLRDYERGGVVEAASPYALWLALRESGSALAVGDLVDSACDRIEGAGGVIEGASGELRILKYVGFEEARWYVPETEPRSAGEPAEVT